MGPFSAGIQLSLAHVYVGNHGTWKRGNQQKWTKITIFNGKTHYKWPFSIAMLVCQRVLRKDLGVGTTEYGFFQDENHAFL